MQFFRSVHTAVRRAARACARAPCHVHAGVRPVLLEVLSVWVEQCCYTYVIISSYTRRDPINQHVFVVLREICFDISVYCSMYVLREIVFRLDTFFSCSSSTARGG